VHSDRYQATPASLVRVFCHKGVSAVIRLNAPEYNAAEFTDHGIRHYDLIFPDCSTPSDQIVDRLAGVYYTLCLCSHFCCAIS
jgi:protein-tyrosine phosphatase